MNGILNIFQSDCGFINNQLNNTHNFDIFENAEKFYFPNLLRNNGYIKKF